MEQLVHNKLTRRIGVSNFDLQLLSDLLTYCKIRPFTNQVLHSLVFTAHCYTAVQYADQVETHLFLKQTVLLRYCEQERIFLTAYSPLGT